MHVSANDTASETSATGNRPRVRLHHPDDVDANSFSSLGLSEVPDGDWRSADFLVGANADGNIEYDALSTGTDTLTVEMRISQMLF